MKGRKERRGVGGDDLWHSLLGAQKVHKRHTEGNQRVGELRPRDVPDSFTSPLSEDFMTARGAQEDWGEKSRLV